MNIESSVPTPSSHWLVALEEGLDELHRGVLLCATDSLLDADAVLTISALRLRDLLEQVRSLPAFAQVLEQRVHQDVSIDGVEDVFGAVGRAADLVRDVVRHPPALGIDELHLLTLAARTIRGIEDQLVRVRS